MIKNPLMTHMKQHGALSMIFRSSGAASAKNGFVPMHQPVSRATILRPGESVLPHLTIKQSPSAQNVSLSEYGPDASVELKPSVTSATSPGTAVSQQDEPIQRLPEKTQASPPTQPLPTTSSSTEQRLAVIMRRHREKAAIDQGEVIPGLSSEPAAANIGSPTVLSPNAGQLEITAVPEKSVSQPDQVANSAITSQPIVLPSSTAQEGPIQRFPELPTNPSIPATEAASLANQTPALTNSGSDVVGSVTNSAEIQIGEASSPETLHRFASNLIPTSLQDLKPAANPVTEIFEQFNDQLPAAEPLTNLPLQPVAQSLQTLISNAAPLVAQIEAGVAQETRPLQEAWAVQTLDPETAVANLANNLQSFLPFSAPEIAQIQDVLQAIPTGQPTDSAVALMRPRLPRPSALPSALPLTHLPLPKVPENLTDTLDRGLPDSLTPPKLPPALSPLPQFPGLLEQGMQDASTVVPSTAEDVASTLSKAVPTEIGELPSDLWGLIGHQPPEWSKDSPITAVQNMVSGAATQLQNTVDNVSLSGLPQVPPPPPLPDDATSTPPQPKTDFSVRRLYQELQAQLTVEWERIRGRYE